MSNDTVDGPIKVRVLTLDSQLGVAEIADADNGEQGTGAIWDFSRTLAGPLAPMQLSSGKTLTFRITDLRPLGAWHDYRSGIAHMDTRIYGRIRKAPPKEDDKKQR
jgi:hypothetical protein